MTSLILHWQEAFEAGLLTCGGKGYHLAQLHRYGFPVPYGGVVVADVYRQLMRAPVLAELTHGLSTLQAEGVLELTVQERLAQAQRVITTTRLPEQLSAELEPFLRAHDLADRPLAVRSSAVSEDGLQASFAGMHQSVLNVCGVDATRDAILRCFASLWTPQAVAYRRRMGFADDDVLCAVVLCATVTAPGGREPHSRAKAIVMETGGYLSHGAIVAREYGLPAVVNIPGILDVLKDGETLTVDGDAATVRRIGRAQTEPLPARAPAGAS
jgi:rifampicin phosphotransferase